MALRERNCCIHGSAGTGKTTTIATLVKEFEYRGLLFTLAAYTGKATSRLNECLEKITNVRASTIHMLLSSLGSGQKGDKGQRSERKQREKDDFDYVILDEASMVPTVLLARMINSLPEETRLVFVGDEQQLQPIDEGSPYCEFLKFLPSVHLDIDCRRTQKGNLFWNLKHIENEEFHRFQWSLDLSSKERQEEQEEQENVPLIDDMHYVEGDDSVVLDLVKHLRDEGCEDTEVTVICPYKEPCDNLNLKCREIWNSGSIDVIDFRHKVWRANDRILMLENRYDIGVMNGEEGRILAIEGGKLVCSFDLRDTSQRQVNIPLHPERQVQMKKRRN